ncbi:hypothetical protein AAEX63_10005 [Luteococcus sp. H138]|uniref:hypothetical protein n=1 Tax=unclassified Luteococcus TaxID=2639923 RepID=UPI00313B2125
MTIPTTCPPALSFRDLGRGERIITILLLSCWVLMLAGTVWATPQRASVAEVERAITSKNIILHERREQVPASAVERLLTSVTVNDEDDPSRGGYLVWKDRSHRWHWTTLDDAAPVAAKYADKDRQYGDSTSDGPPDDATLTYYRFGEHAHTSYFSWEYAGGLLLGAMELGLVIAGAARRGTRWFWFWVLLVPGLPLDAGLLGYLWLEVLNRGTAGRTRRMAGWEGLFFCILVLIVVQMGLSVVRAVL